MFKRILIAFIICFLALGGLTLRDKIEDLQWQLDQTNIKITYELLSIIDRVSSSVVYVEVVADCYSDDYEYEYTGSRSGSGVIIGPCTILTAKHVIEDANSITITLADGNTCEVIEWRVDSNNDCGLLFFEEEFGPVAEFADQVKVGERVIIIGSPYGYDFFNTVTTGIISGLGRKALYFGEDPMITADAASWSGNSGGPVFNMRGQVIGILVGGTWGGDNFSIITPANICRELYEAATEIKSQADKTGIGESVAHDEYTN